MSSRYQLRFMTITLVLAAACWGCGTKSVNEDMRPEGQLSAAQLKDMLDSGREDFVLVDVRGPLEFETGYIPGALLIPYTEIEKRAREIPKNKTVIVYCSVGVRSERARKKLLEMGFSDVLNFGGTKDWPYGLVKPEATARLN